MRRLALATATLFALVTGAVTSEEWHIYATVSGPGFETHASNYVSPDGVPVPFASRDMCEAFSAHARFKVEIKDPFENYELNQHGAGTTIVWTCNKVQAPGQDI